MKHYSLQEQRKLAGLQQLIRVANFRSQDALTASSFPQSMIARLVLNLLKSRDTIAVLQRSTPFDAFPL